MQQQCPKTKYELMLQLASQTPLQRGITPRALQGFLFGVLCCAIAFAVLSLQLHGWMGLYVMVFQAPSELSQADPLDSTVGGEVQFSLPSFVPAVCNPAPPLTPALSSVPLGQAVVAPAPLPAPLTLPYKTHTRVGI